MAESRFELCVRERLTGRIVAAWPPGLQEERDLVADVASAAAGAARDLVPSLVTSVRSKGVGWFKGEDAVVAAVQAALYESSHDAVIGKAVRAAFEGAISDLKLGVKP